MLTEMQSHFRLPLSNQPFGRHDEDPARHAAQFQLAEDQTSLDRLTETNLVRQQIADPVTAHGAVERVELVRQRNDVDWIGASKRLSSSAPNNFAAAALCRMSSTG